MKRCTPKNFMQTAIGMLCLVLTSCGNLRNASYFNNIDFGNYSSTTEEASPLLKDNDLLSIQVASVNQNAADIFNETANSKFQSATTSNGRTSLVSGYLINSEGYISFPILGKIKASGKRKKELENYIAEKLIQEKLLLDPIVTIRLMNFNVSVLGEVQRPGVVNVPNEKISIFEALGLAGDITIYGRRDRVVLIRENEGTKILRRIDLTSDAVFQSPYYYLESNDILYVEPNNAKKSSSTTATQWIPVVLSGISLAIIAIVNL